MCKISEKAWNLSHVNFLISLIGNRNVLKRRVVYVWEDESFKISYIKSIILIIQQCQKSPHIQREGKINLEKQKNMHGSIL
jgi:hypothetical protein